MHSDLDRDLHSVQKHGLFRAYIGWVISKKYHENQLGHVSDLRRYPELEWINRYYFLPNIFFLGGLYLLGGAGLMVYAGLGSIILTWHVAFSVTVLFHCVGTQRYETGDESKNSFLLAFLTLGEGWHNNHHANMSSARLGHEWWQIDLGYFVFVLFEKLGLIWDLNRSIEPIQVIRNSLPGNATLHSVAPDETSDRWDISNEPSSKHGIAV